MVYLSTHSSDYFLVPDFVPKQKKEKVKTKIIVYCASNTECSDYSLIKNPQKSFTTMSFFSAFCVIKRAERKTGKNTKIHFKKPKNFLKFVNFLQKNIGVFENFGSQNGA